MRFIPHWLHLVEYWYEYEDSPAIFAFILYSPADRVLSKYFATPEYWDDLHYLSGDNALIFIIEKPPLERFADIYGDRGYYKYGAEDRVTFNQFEIYEIARLFNIKPDQIPCIVFFTDIEEKEEILIYKFKIEKETSFEDIRDFFRQIIKPIFNIKPKSFSSNGQVVKYRKKLLKALKKGLIKLKIKNFVTTVISKVLKESIDVIASKYIKD